ncbi:MAG TPA: fatty acid desaturase [Polyangiaceae bacterium]|jgi:fatty acid desaturase|nr:fatty acid desaturase [Polyangiaceae bacterium]
MRLRFREDRRTLIWAFVLLPLAPALALARPDLLPWVVPVALYASYCSGVLAHNQNHCPTFTGRGANQAYAAWLSVFYGFPLFAWVPTHNQNHHQYLNGDGDATRTTRRGAVDGAWALFTYPLYSSFWQTPLVARYVRDARARHPARFRRVLVESVALVVGQASLLALAVGLHGVSLGARVYLLSAGLPAALATYFMMFTNYLQHVGCDPASRDDHSRNFVSSFWNWFVFENGLHTVHHEHPGVHWSRYRALHEARAARIDPRLNQNSLFGYVLSTYLFAPIRRRFAVSGAPRPA